jgi:hypothetical protein
MNMKPNVIKFKEGTGVGLQEYSHNLMLFQVT